MTDILLQFHIVPEELLSLVSRFIKQDGAGLLKVSYPPFQAAEVVPATMAEELRDAAVCSVALTDGRPTLPASGMLGLLASNPGALVIDIGRVTSKGLTESALSARTDNVRLLARWRRIANELRKITRTGVTAVNPDTGATAPARNHRFSVGAKALEQQGVPMIALGNGVLLRFDTDTDRLGSTSNKQ